MQELQDNDDGIKLLNDVDYFKVLDFVQESIFSINCCQGGIIEVQPVSPRIPKIRKEKRFGEELEEQKVPFGKDKVCKKLLIKKEKTKNVESLSFSSHDNDSLEILRQ